MGEIRLNSVGWKLLQLIADGTEVVEISSRRSTALLRYSLEDYRTLEAERKRRAMKAALYRLERRKLIEKRIEDGRRVISLTKFGQECVREVQERTLTPLPRGMFTIVSFDIPERFRSERQTFRRFLHQAGFRRYHRSVWISEFDYYQPLAARAKRLRIYPWVTVMQGKMMESLE